MRLQQFDIFKGIGIILVLLGHSLIPMDAKNVIYMFHMPLFFFASGLFFRPRPIGETIINSAKKLLVPWLFFLVIYQLAYLFFTFIANRNFEVYLQYVTSLYNPIDEHSLWYPTIWFLPCLFFIRILYGIISRMCSIIYYRLCLSFVLYIVGHYLSLPFFIDSAIGCVIFYAMGSAFMQFPKMHTCVNSMCAIFFFAVCAIITLYIGKHVEIKDNVYPLYMIALSIPMIWAVYCVSCTISMCGYRYLSGFLAKCGQRTLTIFGLHMPLWFYLMPIVQKLPPPSNNFIKSIVLVVLTLPLLMICDKFIQRYIPFVYGLTKIPSNVR